MVLSGEQQSAFSTCNTEADHRIKTFADELSCIDACVSFQMCKLVRANPPKHGVSDSACLSQLQVIHNPCVLRQGGTGASSASKACQFTVFGCEDLQRICQREAHLCHTATHNTVDTCEDVRAATFKMRIASTAHLSLRGQSSSVSTDAVRLNGEWRKWLIRIK